MHNPYFKASDTAPRYKHRSPSPPRRFVEPLSPQIPHPFEFRTYHAAPYPSGKARHNRASSTIDALAEAALVANSSPGNRSGKGLDTANTHRHPRTHNANEPPHKRARSEYLPPAQMNLYASRPATSNGLHDSQTSAHGSLSYDSRVEEAALLLNFRTGGWPSNHLPSPQSLHSSTAVSRPHANSFPQNFPRHRPPEVSLLPPFGHDASSAPNHQLAPPPGQHEHAFPGTHHYWTPTMMQDSVAAPALNALNQTGTTLPVVDKIQDREVHANITDMSMIETSEPRKGRRGWPKGKLRGPRSRQNLVEKAATRRPASKRSGEGSKPRKTRKSAVDDPPKVAQLVRRKSTSDVLKESLALHWIVRSKSVPPGTELTIHEITSKPGRRKLEMKELTVCAGCSASREVRKAKVELDEWISCNGCKKWFHIDCAGFKRPHEVRDVDKFFCPACESEHGKTTYVRKSKRAHASVDYAELQKGVLKTSEESVEHHYIQPIKDGTFEFDPENFPRMRPELITREFFERSGTFVEPVCIPAEWNPRPWTEHASAHDSQTPEESKVHSQEIAFQRPSDSDFEFDETQDVGQDRLDMVMPQDLTVRQVCNLVGPDMPLDVIDVKTQNSGAKWTLSRWADYYEEVSSEKAIRNVISLEVSQTRLGRLLRRPKVVRDIDLQDEVWPQEETDRGKYPKVQYYCLMSIADSYTDFHIDFGGSSVYYHILKGKKTFFFIPPKAKHLKAYEEWNDSPQQNYTFLPNITKECYRVDLDEGDTMLIPSGWIHAVWTPADSLVIGGNFLTRMSFKNQFKVAEIEKNNETPMKFRYPFFQRLMWYTAIHYLQNDPMPEEVSQLFFEGQQFQRQTPIWNDFEGELAERDPRVGAPNARFYSQAEVDGLPDLANFIFRTVMMVMGRVEGISQDRMKRINASIPKGHGEPLDIAKRFALWVAWKRGNEHPPAWAHPDAVLPSDKDEAHQKKLSARALKDMERKEAIAAWRIAPDRQSARVQSKNAAAVIKISPPPTALPEPISVPEVQSEVDFDRLDDHKTPVKNSTTQPPTLVNDATANVTSPHISTPKTSVLGPKRVACDACRKRRIRCKHKDLVQQFHGNGIFPDTVLDPAFSDLNTHFQGSTSVAQGPSYGFPVLVANDLYPIEGPAGRDETAASRESVGPCPRSSQDTCLISTGLPNGSVPLIQNGVTIFGEVPKRGRTKACFECRKSKRRCVHDENGNVDPVKAAETPVPRGSIAFKKRQSDEHDGLSPRKKSRNLGSGLVSLNGSPAAGFGQLEQSQDHDGHGGVYSAQNQQSFLDPNLFMSCDAVNARNDDFGANANTRGFEMNDLEQIANEVLGIDGANQDNFSNSQEKPKDPVLGKESKMLSQPLHGHADSGIEAALAHHKSSTSEPTPTAGPRSSGLDERSPVNFSSSNGLLTAPSTNQTTELNGGSQFPYGNGSPGGHDLPLYHPLAQLSQPSVIEDSIPDNHGRKAGMTDSKRKRDSKSSTPAPKSAKKVKTEASRAVQENEDELLAKLLQQEALGLRRRGC